MATDALRSRLDALHARLLQLHRVLLDEVRRAYEAEHGRVGGPGAMLQLVTQDEFFAWLRPLSRMVIDLEDVGLDAAAQGAARALVAPLFEDTSAFQARAAELVQSHHAVATAYAEALSALYALPGPNA